MRGRPQHARRHHQIAVAVQRHREPACAPVRQSHAECGAAIVADAAADRTAHGVVVPVHLPQPERPRAEEIDFGRHRVFGTADLVPNFGGKPCRADRAGIPSHRSLLMDRLHEAGALLLQLLAAGCQRAATVRRNLFLDRLDEQRDGRFRIASDREIGRHVAGIERDVRLDLRVGRAEHDHLRSRADARLMGTADEIVHLVEPAPKVVHIQREHDIGRTNRCVAPLRVIERMPVGHVHARAVIDDWAPAASRRAERAPWVPLPCAVRGLR